MATEVVIDSKNGEAALAHEIATESAASVADPGPLGLAAFALTTFCLSMVNAEVVAKATEPIVFGLALSYGGIAQVLAGMWEFKKGNTFGATAFTSYGAFWISFWAFVQFYAAKVPKENVHTAVGLFLFAWGFFTLYMLVAALRTNMAVAATFAVLTVTFFLLAYGNSAQHANLVKLGGWTGIITAGLAWYASMAGVTKSTFGKAILPNPSLAG
jgi:succinate-acetate transporter protein